MSGEPTSQTMGQVQGCWVGVHGSARGVRPVLKADQDAIGGATCGGRNGGSWLGHT